MPKLGLGLGLTTSQVKGFSPKTISGLSLWVSADHGVTLEDVTFIDEIVISGCNPSTSNGTYTRGSDGNTQFNDEATGNYIYNSSGVWFLHDEDAGLDTFFNGNFLNTGSWDVFAAQSFGTAVNSTSTYNDAITEIADRSSSANNLSRDVGLLNLSTDIINGKPAFYFQGERFTGNDIVTAKTIYAVIKTDDEPPTNYSVILEATGGGLYSNVSLTWGSYFDGSFSPNDPLDTNSPYILGTISDDGETYELRQNGTIAKSASDGNGFVSRSALHLGSNGTSAQSAKCYVAEVIVYDRAITNTEAEKLEAYLNAKYSVY